MACLWTLEKQEVALIQDLCSCRFTSVCSDPGRGRRSALPGLPELFTPCLLLFSMKTSLLFILSFLQFCLSATHLIRQSGAWQLDHHTHTHTHNRVTACFSLAWCLILSPRLLSFQHLRFSLRHFNLSNRRNANTATCSGFKEYFNSVFPVLMLLLHPQLQ